MAELALRGVSKRFNETLAVREASFTIPDGEFWALLGPSGCGKTTILRLAAGFERVSSGSLAIGGETVSSESTHLPPEARHVGIVFQSYALWPHMSVAANVGYSLDVAGVRGAERERRILAALASVGLEGLTDRRPSQLSGGQQQRVALARCLVMEPRLLLFDEPLANLDVHLRATMEEEFVRVQKQTRATVLYITHDQSEAMAMADRIVVMDHGVICQIAAPRTLYREPRTAMVAGFIGQGGLLDAEVLGPVEAGRCPVRIGAVVTTVRAEPAHGAGPATISVRPEDLRPTDAGEEGALAVRVLRSTYKGQYEKVEVETARGERLVLQVREHLAPGAALGLRIDDGWVLPAGA